MSQFSVIELDSSSVDAAFPLVQALAPEVPLGRWRSHARRMLEEGGLLGLAGADGTLFGMLSYRKHERLSGPVLQVDDFVTIELSRAAPGRHLLCEAVEEISRELGCAIIELRLASRGFVKCDSWRLLSWVNLGHWPEGVILAKALDSGSLADVPNQECA